MKRISITLLLAAAAVFAPRAGAQSPANPGGTVLYSLPSTVLHLEVTATCENFQAGPYAAYARKYLGSEARTTSGPSWRISSITLTPYIEADPSARHTVKLSARKAASSPFLQMCAQGVVSMMDSHTGNEEPWRFPSIAARDRFAGKDPGGNLTSATTTLYQRVNGPDGFRRVSVQQSEVVEKSLENKAAEAAQMIFRLRKSRVQIITGDTDATFSGDALGDAIEETARLEAEYMSLFYGLSENSTQTAHFDVIPRKDAPGQVYIAFRISESGGLMAAEELEGRPVVLELKFTPPKGAAEEGRRSRGEPIYYRTPAIASVRILDGAEVLLQSRVPIYQLGETCTFPAN